MGNNHYSDAEGIGVSLKYGTTLGKTYGESGIDVTHSLNEDLNDPSNFQIKISGSQIYNQLSLKANSANVYTKAYVH